jgi:DNA-damage-inducible protein J
MSNCIVRSRIDSHIKIKATVLFEHMGLTLSEAIRIFLYQSIAEERIPFTINLPNATTKAALEAVAEKKGIEKTSLAKLRKDWDKARKK